MIQYDSEGIITQTLTEILDEREDSLKEVMGDDFVIDKTSPIGNMELADANNELAIQELIAWLIPNMIDANTATGYFLDCICEKNRIYRKQPEYTTFKLILNGLAKSEFLTGDITVLDSISGVYYDLNEDCVIGDDGTVTAQFKCESFGDYRPVQSSTFSIETPVYGLDSVTMDYSNLDLSIGRFTESDEELRQRRKESVGQTSTNTLDSIKGNLYSLDNVQKVVYFENETESTDANGLPMKSFEFVIDGGDSDEIAKTIFNNKPAGTRAYGTTEITVQDSENVNHQIGFTRVTDVNLRMDIVISTTSTQSETFKSILVNALKEQFDNIQGIGDNVRDYSYFAVLTPYSEISDITSIKFASLADPYTQVSQYTIQPKEIARITKEDIHITISN